MKIYKIVAINEYMCYDGYNGHIVAANNTIEVLDLVQKHPGDESKWAWIEENIEEIGNYTGSNTEPFIILSDFAAG